MIWDAIIFYHKPMGVSDVTLMNRPLRFDQRDLTIPRIGESVDHEKVTYKVLDVVYNYDQEIIEVHVKKKGKYD